MKHRSQSSIPPSQSARKTPQPIHQLQQQELSPSSISVRVCKPSSMNVPLSRNNIHPAPPTLVQELGFAACVEDEKKESHSPPCAPQTHFSSSLPLEDVLLSPIAFVRQQLPQPAIHSLRQPDLASQPVSQAASKSAKSAQGCSNNRRSIFGDYWGKPEAPPSPTTPLKCTTPSSTLDQLPEQLGSSDPHGQLRRLVRPPSDRRLINRPHFVDLDRVPVEAHELLPRELPTPLRRFYGTSSTTASTASWRTHYLQGAYPILRAPPRSILRQCSYGKQTATTATRSIYSNEDDSLSSSDGTLCASGSSQESFFNMTNSVTLQKQRQQRAAFNKSQSSHEPQDSEDGSVSSSSSRIRFDPRVTVSEFDDPVPRDWYSGCELERFKWDAITLVQHYLCSNPPMYQLYNQVRIDPVTGTLRKKALFTVPILREEQAESLIRRSQDSAAQQAEQHVHRLLIAARNPLVTELLRKSVQSLFPKAEITTVRSAEAALQAIKTHQEEASACFDIALVEGRLNRPSHNQARSLDRLQDFGLSAEQPVANELGSPHILSHKTTSGNNLGSMKRISPISGLDLIQQLQATSTKSMLVVGLSASPELDTRAMKSCGTDMVWGLPPPTMNNVLRDSLVKKLSQKRQRQSQAS